MRFQIAEFMISDIHINGSNHQHKIQNPQQLQVLVHGVLVTGLMRSVN